MDKTSFYSLDPQKSQTLLSYDINTSYYACYRIHNDKLYIADFEQTIKVYDLSNLQTPEKVINLCNTWALEIKFFNDLMFVGTDDHHIRVYDQSFKWLDEMGGHKDGVYKIEFAGDMVYSASYDHSVRSWDLQEMYSRIKERKTMLMEDFRAKQLEVYLKCFPRKIKKGKKGKKKSKKKK